MGWIDKYVRRRERRTARKLLAEGAGRSLLLLGALALVLLFWANTSKDGGGAGGGSGTGGASSSPGATPDPSWTASYPVPAPTPKTKRPAPTWTASYPVPWAR